MSFELVNCTDDGRWNAFVASSPQGNLFCDSRFMNAIGEERDQVFLEENGVPQAGAIIAKKNGSAVRGPYPLTMYQGVLYSASHSVMPSHKRVKRELDLCSELLRMLSERYDRISFCLHYAVEDIRGFQWFNYHEPGRGQFRIVPAYTGLIDLGTCASFDDYLMSVRSIRRNEYRRASASRMIVEESEDVDLLDRLHEATFQRQSLGRDPEEARSITMVARAALSGGYGKLLICRGPSGEAMSATLFLYYSGCGYYLVGANDMAYRNSGSGVLLLLENIRRCFDINVSKIDVVGINSPNRGDFKTSFNAVPVPYFIVDWVRPASS